jgi:ribose transport system substrate-binding protein
MQLLEDGVLDATFDYPTGGAEAIDVALKLLNGEEVPKKIILGTTMYTADNIDDGGEYIPPDEPTEEIPMSKVPEKE